MQTASVLHSNGDACNGTAKYGRIVERSKESPEEKGLFWTRSM